MSPILNLYIQMDYPILWFRVQNEGTKPNPCQYRERFKERGMDITTFYLYGLKTEQKFEARGVRANSRMEKIQKEIAERSRAADGIQPFGTYQQRSSKNLQSEHKNFQPMLHPFGHSLDDRIQHLQHQQMQQHTRERRKKQLMQQMMQ